METGTFRVADVLGRPVVFPDGRRRGEVKALLFDPGTAQLRAFVLASLGLLRRSAYVAVADVRGASIDSVVLAPRTTLRRRRWAAAEWIRLPFGMVGLPVNLPSGERLGSVADIVVQLGTGQIMSVEVQGGFRASPTDRRELSGGTIVSLARECLVVTPPVVEQRREPGAISRAIGVAAYRLGRLAGKAGRQLKKSVS